MRFESINTLLICIYHPYWGKVKEHNIFLTLLQTFIDQNLRPQERLIVTGDINDLRNSIDNFLLSNNLVQIVSFPTRGHSILDIICIPVSLCHLYNKPDKFAPLGRSDHAVISLQPVIKAPTSTTKRIRDFSPKNRALFGELVNSVNWSEILTTVVSLDDSVELFENTLACLFDHCFPFKSVKISSRDPPWVNAEVKLLMKQKDHAYHRHNYAKYIAIRERLHKLILFRKRAYFKNVSNQSPKHIWKRINSLIKPSVTNDFPSNNNLDDISRKFSAVFEPLESLCDYPVGSEDTDSLPPINEWDILPLILGIKSNAAGIDGIPGFIFRQYAYSLVSPITMIVNKSIRQHCFPRNWKYANVIPIPKNNSEFRPISLLPFCSKVLEKAFLRFILLPRVLSLFNSNQFGFLPRSHSSTSNATTAIRMHTLNQLTSYGGYVRCLAIDFLKAFDKASHSIILRQCEFKFRLSPSILSWIKSFLTDRHQRVIGSGSMHTDWSACTSGVPQGSILGPILFCTIIDSFSVASIRSTAIIYADDLTILHHVGCNHTDEIDLEISNLYSWASMHRLSINASKTKLMNFSLSLQSAPSVFLNGCVLNPVRELKLLGVIFTETCNPIAHGQHTVRRCCSGMAAVRRLFFSGISGHTLRAAYEALVVSHIRYCWPAVCDMPQSIMRQYQNFDREVSRLAGVAQSVPLTHSLNAICVKLITLIGRDPLHPLYTTFRKRTSIDMDVRSRCSLVPWNRSSRLLRSFARYYKLS